MSELETLAKEVANARADYDKDDCCDRRIRRLKNAEFNLVWHVMDNIEKLTLSIDLAKAYQAWRETPPKSNDEYRLNRELIDVADKYVAANKAAK